METINERLKYLRKKLGLSQAAFGDKIRITKASVSRIESGINNPSDQTITLICKEFNISEHWLITGEGEQAISTKESLLDQLKSQYGLTDLEMRILTSYLDLPHESRKKFEEFIQELLKKEASVDTQFDQQMSLDKQDPLRISDDSKQLSLFDTEDGSFLNAQEEAAYAEYIKNTLNSAGNTDSSVSSGSAETESVNVKDRASGE